MAHYCIGQRIVDPVLRVAVVVLPLHVFLGHAIAVVSCTCMLAQRVLRPREQAHVLRLNPDHLISSSPLAMCLQKSSLTRSYTDRFLLSSMPCLVLPSIPWLDISCTKISSATTRKLTIPTSCVQQKLLHRALFLALHACTAST